MKSWRPNTSAQYSSYLRKWLSFLDERDVSANSTISVNIVLEFLTMLHKQGLSYSAINTARSAISSVVHLDSGSSVGSHPLVQRFMKGIFNIKPNLPTYIMTWDVSTVLRYMESMNDNESLTLIDISMKLCMLIALITGQRSQTLAALDINHMFRYNDKIEFNIKTLLKQSRPSYHLKPLVIIRFEEKKLCAFQTLIVYLEKTRSLRQSDKLFITTHKPYKAASSDTISRWLKSFLHLAGIDTNTYKGHSVRSASTSAVKAAGVPINVIMSKAGWTNAKTFANL